MRTNRHGLIGNRLLALLATLFVAASCGDVSRTGRSPVYLILNSLQAAPGGGHGAGILAGSLSSDVLVLVTTGGTCSTTSPCPTIYNDSGQAILSTALKDIGTTASPTTPTSNNAVTITRVHVQYVRADGHNTPGVDVPYAFDGAATGTVLPASQLTLTFELVRTIAKAEPPLMQLVNSGAIITTIANVTFYGTDQVGNAVSVTGSILVDFGDFGDT